MPKMRTAHSRHKSGKAFSERCAKHLTKCSEASAPPLRGLPRVGVFSECCATTAEEFFGSVLHNRDNRRTLPNKIATRVCPATERSGFCTSAPKQWYKARTQARAPSREMHGPPRRTRTRFSTLRLTLHTWPGSYGEYNLRGRVAHVNSLRAPLGPALGHMTAGIRTYRIDHL